MESTDNTAWNSGQAQDASMRLQDDHLVKFQRTRPSRKHRLGFLDEAVANEYARTVPDLSVSAEPAPPVATRSGRVVSKPKHFTDFAATEAGVPAS